MIPIICDCGKQLHRKGKYGPTGRKKWLVLMHSCGHCGRHYKITGVQYTAEQENWIDRWNKRMTK